MILTRPGNKRAVAAKVIQHFPKHDMYVEPFFGAGGIFFNKPVARHNFLNDLNDDVYNLWRVIQTHKAELIQQLHDMPIHDTLFQHWRKNKETAPVMQAVRFLFLSNFGYMGKNDSLRMSPCKPKKIIERRITETVKRIKHCHFKNDDFERFIKSLHKEKGLQKSCFIYNDPPYINTGNNYETHSWTESDFCRLLDVNEWAGCKFAVSEFNHPFVLEEAQRRRLTVVNIGERRNMKNRRSEILIINYPTSQYKLF